MYLVKALDTARAAVARGVIVNWSTDDIRFVDDDVMGFINRNPTVFSVLAGPVLFSQDGSPAASTFVLTNSDGLYSRDIVEEAGVLAVSNIDFNAVGETASSVTIGGVVYLEADTADAPNGVWTNGVSATASATSLIAAINGDTRAVVPFTALADVSGDGVLLVADAVGAAGNLVVATDSIGAITVRNFVNGADAATHDITRIVHTVTTQELLTGAVEIPLPFTPTGFNITAVSATGAPVYFTDLVTIETSPDRITITTNGATNLADTDVVHLTAFN